MKQHETQQQLTLVYANGVWRRISNKKWLSQVFAAAAASGTGAGRSVRNSDVLYKVENQLFLWLAHKSITPESDSKTTVSVSVGYFTSEQKQLNVADSNDDDDDDDEVSFFLHHAKWLALSEDDDDDDDDTAKHFYTLNYGLLSVGTYFARSCVFHVGVSQSELVWVLKRLLHLASTLY